MKVNFYATLRQIVGGKTVEVPLPNGATAGQLVEEVVRRHPALRPAMMDEQRNLKQQVHVFINGRDSSLLENALETVLAPDDKVDIFPPVGGG